MRRLLALAAISISGLGLAIAVDPAGAVAAHRFPPTQKTIVRPVNAAGFARPGYTVTPEPTNHANCSFPDPAPSAVSPNIETCSPTVAAAFACWNAAAPHKILCIGNPRARKLVRIPRSGPFAPTGLAPAAERAPLSMVLANGDYCSFDTGGTGAIRVGHPLWRATYNCNDGKFLWRRPGAKHSGVFERFPDWTVIEARASGPITARHVLRAWFVGTFTA
jgi:hypothetical protein